MAKRMRFALSDIAESRSKEISSTQDNANYTKTIVQAEEVSIPSSTSVETTRSEVPTGRTNDAEPTEALDSQQTEGGSVSDSKLKRMSLYLEEDLYWRISDYAHRRRSKMHPIIVRGLRQIISELEAEERSSISR